jgi:ribulose-phosphate 3-epimerase
VHLNRTIQLIRGNGAHPGVVLNPSTPLTTVDWLLEYVDYVLIMSVNPGFGGQTFIPNCLDKIKSLRAMIQGRKLKTMIEVDGGVNAETIEDLAAAGVDIFVSGSAIFGSASYKKTIDGFHEKIGRKK